MFETLRAEIDGNLGRLTLDRPKKLNPLSTTTLTELAAAARWFDEQPDVKVVIHYHSRFGTVWANAQRIPPIYDQTSAQVDGELVLVDEYNAEVSDASEGARCAEALGDAKWALLANHGVLLVARDVRQAHLRALTLEWRCRQAWRVEALGGGRPVAKDVADRMGNMIDTNGFPFLWEAMARRELRADPAVLQ